MCWRPAWSAPLLARMPEVAAAIENPFAHGAFDWAGRKALGRRLASADFSAAYVLPNSWKSALVPFFAGIPRRTGYTGEARFLLLNDRTPLDKAALPRLVDRYAALAGPADGPTPEPRLTSTPAQQRAARAALGLPEDADPVIFCPGAEYGPAKRWPTHHFADRWPEKSALAGRQSGLSAQRKIATGWRRNRPSFRRCSPQPLRPHQSRTGHRPDRRRTLRGQQRFRPDARRRRARPPARCALWFVEPRLHAAALGACENTFAATRVQPLLQA